MSSVELAGGEPRERRRRNLFECPPNDVFASGDEEIGQEVSRSSSNLSTGRVHRGARQQRVGRVLR